MAMGGERIVEELETLLRRFKEEEVPEEKMVAVKLEDPLFITPGVPLKLSNLSTYVFLFR
jgi:hypothetical protein